MMTFMVLALAVSLGIEVNQMKNDIMLSRLIALDIPELFHQFTIDYQRVYLSDDERDLRL